MALNFRKENLDPKPYVTLEDKMSWGWFQFGEKDTEHRMGRFVIYKL